MQMGIMDHYEFRQRGVKPAATVVYMDGSGNADSFTLEWDDAVRRFWHEDMLPKLVMFYLNSMLPVLIGDLPLAAPYAASQPTAIVSPLARPLSSQDEDEAAPMECDFEPQKEEVEEGTVLWDYWNHKYVVVKRVMDDGRVILKRDDTSPLKAKPCKLSKETYAVVPVRNPTEPRVPGQRVLINAINKDRAHLNLVGKKGTIATIASEKATVCLDGGEKLTRVNVKCLHALGPMQEPTAPCVHSNYFIDLGEFWEYFQKHQDDTGLCLVGVSEKKFREIALACKDVLVNFYGVEFPSNLENS